MTKAKLVRAIYQGDGNRVFPGTGLVKPGDPVMVTAEQLATLPEFAKPPKTTSKGAGKKPADKTAGAPAEEG